MRVGPRGPAREKIQGEKHHQSARHSVQEVKHARSHHESEEEQLPLCPQDSERAVQGPEDGIALHCHAILETLDAEEPGKKVDG